MNLTTEGKRTRLLLEGELTVGRAGELLDLLRTALHRSDAIEIDLAGVTGMDLSCLQLLCAAHRTALRDGTALGVADPRNQVFRQAGEHAGFARRRKCRFDPQIDCLWNGGAEIGETGDDG